MSILKFATPILIGTLLFSGCKKEEDPPAPPAGPVVHDEVFTTMKLILTNTEPINGVYETFTFTYRDLDGEGGQAPTVETAPLPMGAYGVTVKLYNESASPTIDLTAQIRAHAISHQFFYEPQNVNLVIYDLDLDANGERFGMNFYTNALAPSTGTLKVTLVHDPDKSADGVAQGNIANAGGEIDMEVVFPIVIQ